MAWNENIKTLREQNNLTQQQLADRLYVSRQTVCRWESGSRCPDLPMAKRIAEAFEVTIDELLSEKEARSGSEKHRFPYPAKIVTMEKLQVQRGKIRELIQIVAGISIGINILIMGAYGRHVPAWAWSLDVCVKAMLCSAYFMTSRKVWERKYKREKTL